MLASLKEIQSKQPNIKTLNKIIDLMVKIGVNCKLVNERPVDKKTIKA